MSYFLNLTAKAGALAMVASGFALAAPVAAQSGDAVQRCVAAVEQEARNYVRENGNTRVRRVLNSAPYDGGTRVYGIVAIYQPGPQPGSAGARYDEANFNCVEKNGQIVSINFNTLENFR